MYKGAGILITKQFNTRRLVLLGQRWSGQWTIPGGGAEKRDKTRWNTAKRETIEEFGSLPQFNYLFSVFYSFYFFDWRTDVVEISAKHIRYPRHSRIDRLEFFRTKWFDIENLPVKLNPLLVPVIIKLKAIDNSGAIMI